MTIFFIKKVPTDTYIHTQLAVVSGKLVTFMRRRKGKGKERQEGLGIGKVQ